MNTKNISEYNFNSSQQLETNTIFELAVKHQLDNCLADAEQLYHQVLEKQPLHLKALYNLASLHQTQGDLDSAIAFYQKVININPNRGEVYLQLGKVYQQQGSLKNAISAYRQGISLINPHYAEVLKNKTDLESKTLSVTPPLHQGEVSINDYQFPEIPKVSKLGKRPFWSVVLPIYSNNERINYILECLVSILTQWTGKD